MCRSTPFWSFCFLGVNLLMSETKIGDFCEVMPELGIEIYWKFIFLGFLLYEFQCFVGICIEMR